MGLSMTNLLLKPMLRRIPNLICRGLVVSGVLRQAARRRALRLCGMAQDS
jgi:hypothetical protein